MGRVHPARHAAVVADSTDVVLAVAADGSNGSRSPVGLALAMGGDQDLSVLETRAPPALGVAGAARLCGQYHLS